MGQVVELYLCSRDTYVRTYNTYYYCCYGPLLVYSIISQR